MNRVVQFVFALLVAATLLLTPVGACAAQPDAPTHPCCPPKPVPLPDDCARPGCIYMDTHVTPAASPTADDASPVSTSPSLPTGIVTLPVYTPARAVMATPPPLRERFVVFHQILV